jgi:hypothetical protein
MSDLDIRLERFENGKYKDDKEFKAIIITLSASLRPFSVYVTLDILRFMLGGVKLEDEK